MQVQQLPIYHFLEGTDKSFVIPVYQRDYAWTRINCQKLWDDLVALNNHARNDHFLGTLVTISRSFQEYIVIDGQQRLTTISILLIALQTYLKNKMQRQNDENILIDKLSDFLINKHEQEKKRVRLKPNKQDQEHFEHLFDNGNKIDANSNIINNFDFFYKKISSEALTPAQIFDSFKKLKIVLIDLVRGQDDPQLIFESLNSTGVDLTAGDLIRNYILMDLEPQQQERMYTKYWTKIEKFTGDVAEFIRNYLIFKQKISIKKADVYSEFKTLSVDKDKEEVLQELMFFAEIYSWLVQIQDHPNDAINEQLSRLNKLEFTICHPFLLDLFNESHLGNLDEVTVRKVLNMLESYAFRKILVDNTTQGLNKLFVTLAKEIKKEQNWQEQYLNILSYILLEKRVSQRFPTDEEFENALINKEIYSLQSKNKNFLLESLENFKTAYPINIEELTIEHIMPQKLSKEWKAKLGDNYQEIHRKYLHTLGNLTLTAKNSELSNSSFKDKQHIDFKISKLKLNFKLDDLNHWNEETILERVRGLVEEAKEIWSYPTTTYAKAIDGEQIFDLNSDDNFTGNKPSVLYFENDEKGMEIKTWRDLLMGTCNFLYKFSPTRFKEIQNNPEFKMFFDVKKPLRNPLEFRPGVFVEGNISANNTIAFLSKLCERLNYPQENIQFSIKSANEAELAGLLVG